MAYPGRHVERAAAPQFDFDLRIARGAHCRCEHLRLGIDACHPHVGPRVRGRALLARADVEEGALRHRHEPAPVGDPEASACTWDEAVGVGDPGYARLGYLLMVGEAEADACRRDRITITTFMIATDSYLVDFVDKLTKINRGRAYYASPYNLAEFLFTDYIRNRKKFLH